MARSDSARKGAKKVKNTRRPLRRQALRARKAEPGRCGSAWCSTKTGCSPWRATP